MYDKRYVGRRNFMADEDVIRKIAELKDGRSYGACPCNDGELSCPIGSGSMPALAMVYVPYQSFCDLYSEEKGLTKGTVFAQLDKPFTPNDLKNGRGGNCNGCKM